MIFGIFFLMGGGGGLGEDFFGDWSGRVFVVLFLGRFFFFLICR